MLKRNITRKVGGEVCAEARSRTTMQGVRQGVSANSAAAQGNNRLASQLGIQGGA